MENLIPSPATDSGRPAPSGAPLPPAAAGASLPSGETQAAQIEALRLAEAFQIFNQVSEELSTAYTRLQAQVAELTSELAAANGALRQQYLEKAALTERLSLLLDALPAGVVVLDADGLVVQNNPAAERLLALAGAPGLIGQAWPDIEQGRLQAGETPGEYMVANRTAAENTTADATGQTLTVAITVTALDSAGGRIVLLHDITETQRLKTQSERNQRLAAMGEMAAQLAHQLRTPLAAALLYAGNLEMAEVAPATRINIAGKAVARLKHLERLIQEMLLFARGEVLGREAIDVAELLRELRHTIEPLAQAKQVTFQLQAAAGLPALQGNRKAIVGALVNLLENALHAASAAPAGEVRLSVAVEAGLLVLRVSDNGAGMTPDVLARLFEPFFTTRVEGTGLGLAIARGVARAHNGNIDVRSTPGHGTEFIVTLPLRAGQAVDA
ncbi:MAG: PAS domain-containing protein [Sterolibacterium sp.]|nr:PAS domain-containing protein [Sterolibacterium sp.]